MPLYLYQSVWGGAFLVKRTLQFRWNFNQQIGPFALERACLRDAGKRKGLD
jgi:hypothetical protein